MKTDEPTDIEVWEALAARNGAPEAETEEYSLEAVSMILAQAAEDERRELERLEREESPERQAEIALEVKELLERYGSYDDSDEFTELFRERRRRFTNNSRRVTKFGRARTIF